MSRSVNVLLSVLWLTLMAGCCCTGISEEEFTDSGTSATASGSPSGVAGAAEEFTPPEAPYQLTVEQVGSFKKGRDVNAFFTDENEFILVTSNDDGEMICQKYAPASGKTTEEPIVPPEDWELNFALAGGNAKWAVLSLLNDDFDERLAVLDGSSGEFTQVFEIKRKAHYHAISADGKWVVGGEYDDNDQPDVSLFNAETGEEVARTKIADVDLKGISMSADGQRVVFSTGGTEPTALQVWDTTENKVRELVTVTSDCIAKISPDGKTIAATLPTDGVYPKFVLLDAETGQVSKTLSIKDSPMDLAFSADGKLLMVGWVLYGGGAIIDVASGGKVATLDSDERLLEARFTNNGQYLTAQKLKIDFDIDHDEMLVWELKEK